MKHKPLTKSQLIDLAKDELGIAAVPILLKRINHQQINIDRARSQVRVLALAMPDTMDDIDVGRKDLVDYAEQYCQAVSKRDLLLLTLADVLRAAGRTVDFVA